MKKIACKHEWKFIQKDQVGHPNDQHFVYEFFCIFCTLVKMKNVWTNQFGTEITNQPK